MRIILGLVILLSVLAVACPGYCLDGVEILAGFFDGDLKNNNDDYLGIPLMVAFNFDAKPFLSQIGIAPPGRVNFVVEPFITTIIDPDANIEAGTNLLMKYTFSLTERFQPYIKGGAGVVYMTQHTAEQSTQYNFLPQIGGGAHLFLQENLALSCEFRYRHLSNREIKSPNDGINVHVILAGISIFF